MFKKIYSLLASILILAGCSNEVLEDTPQPPVKESEITLSFEIDAPMLTVSKSSAVPAEGSDPQPWVKNLVLYTFDETGAFLESVVAKPVSTGSANYTAVILKTTRSIHFVSNYGDTEAATLIPGITAESHMETVRTNEYIYWAVKAFNPTNPAFTTPIELIRNWSRLSLVNLSATATQGLENVKYYVYSNPTYTTFGQQTGQQITLPATNTWNRPTSEPAVSEWKDPSVANTYTYLRENDNYKANATFIIVKGTYKGDNKPYYYKIDISNTNDKNITTVYNIIRNKWYQISIQSVLQKGVSTWAEVIADGKLPDNNLMAAAEISDYPKVAYGGYTLEIIPKTTYIFTNPSANQLSFDVEYRNPANQLINGQLADLYFPSDISNVVNGVVSLNKTTGKVTANIHNVTPGQVKETEFYIIGGELQRRIKLILRPAYNFNNFTLTSVEPSADSPVTAHFELPSDIDNSIFPLEVSFTSTKLYSVEPGVRIVTGSNKTYTYVYTIQSYQSAGYNVRFQTNSTNITDPIETVKLTAPYFNDATADLRLNNINNYSTIKGTFQSVVTYNGTNYNAANITGVLTVNYTLNGAKSSTFTVTNGVPQNAVLPIGATGISLSYVIGGVTYTVTGLTFNTLTGTGVKTLTTAGRRSTVDRNTSSRYKQNDTNISGAITYEYPGGSGTFTVTSGQAANNTYIYTPTNITSVTLKYGNYSSTPTITNITSNTATGKNLQ